MATYTQEAKRLILVGETFQDGATAAGDAATAGQILLKAANGAAAAPFGAPAILELGTGATQYQSTNPLNLVSEILKPGMVADISTKVYDAPAQATEVMTVLDADHTFTVGEEVILSLRFDGYGSLSMKNYITVYGSHVCVAGDDASTVTAALADSITLSLAKTRTRNVGVVATGTPATDGILTITGMEQTKIDFQNMIHGVDWKSTLTVDSEALPHTSATTPYSNGSGWGEEVALIEEFANGSTARNQWVEYRLMYDRRLQAIKTGNYDVTNFKIKTTKDGAGSNVTSFREVQVYFITGTGDAATLAGALQDYV